MFRHKIFLLLAGFVLLLAGGRPAQAALYCIDVPGYPVECAYEDARECRRLADERGGTCMANLPQITASMGSDPICIVYSPTTVQCLYQDFSTCDRDAELNNAACVNMSRVQVIRQSRSGSVDTQNFGD